MAFCANCGTQMGEGVKFCPSCGTQAGGVAPAKSATEKVGNIRKCPACGAQVPSMTAVCAECGHEFSNVQVANSVQVFFEKLERLSDDKEKLSYISNFPVPNTKEDLLEFAIMASSQIKPVHGMVAIGTGYLRLITLGVWKGPIVFRLNKAWRSKIKQVYSKGRIVLTSDKSAFSQIAALFADVEKMEKKSKMSLLICIASIIAFYILLLAPIVVWGFRTADKETETSRLNELYTEIVQNIKSGDLLDAKLKLNQLIWEYDSSEQKANWAVKRETLLKELEALEAKAK